MRLQDALETLCGVVILGSYRSRFPPARLAAVNDVDDGAPSLMTRTLASRTQDTQRHVAHYPTA